MKKFFILSLMATLSACGGDNNFDDISYLSCQINSSHAVYVIDREIDVAQCWDTEIAYKSQVLAVQSCGKQVNLYLKSRYLDPHTVTYSVQTTHCQ
ncbi:MAG: hypothetical protein HRT55_14310 [Colwellia sp.]|uniref:hypothetical protein n=1 Tax=Colwellia sp. TaxID=56799 RepID=UPI0025B957A4|nr:hypothetical protein [Colwellia sp.]NQZ27478.1 hypothetical protein [Colwellia sp.]